MGPFQQDARQGRDIGGPCHQIVGDLVIAQPFAQLPYRQARDDAQWRRPEWRPREWWSFPALMFSVLTADVKAIVRRSVRTV